MIWDFLVARYSCLEETQIYLKHVKDVEFKAIIERIGVDLLERQAKELEKQMEIYKIPLPQRPPKSATQPADNENLSDQYMFRKIFEGCQTFIDMMAHSIRSSITTEPVRQMFARFLKEEISVFDNMCKYAKVKGWIETPPTY